MEAFRADLAAAYAALGQAEGPLVPGEGGADARIVLIGEAPGEQEVKQGRPFVGKAGRNLDFFLSAAQLDRRALYVTNAVKFRPTRRSAAGRTVNRPPTQAEIDWFRPWLLRELRLIAPLCVVTLGNTPLRALLNAPYRIGEVHGQWIEAEGLPVYPMYHPASLIYSPALKPVYLEDILRFGAWVREQDIALISTRPE